MEILIYAGVVLTLGGVALLVYCILQAAKARKAGGTDDEIRVRLQRVITLNLIALMISAIGLGAVTIGSILS
jgi:hypothetical protein